MTPSPSVSAAPPSPWVRRFSALVAPGAPVLDVACGSGRHMHWFAQRGHPVTGVDRDAHALAAARAWGEVIEADIILHVRDMSHPDAQAQAHDVDEVLRELDIDTEGQLIASVLSKKISAGATHVVIDIPVGPTAKVRSKEAAQHLAARLAETAAQFGLVLRCIFSDGNQPVGCGIGPALEAQDVLAVLHRDDDAPMDLRERAASVAGAVLELAGAATEGDGMRLALETIDSGRAWEKFQRICAAQGGLRQPPVAEYVEPLIAAHAGRVVHIDNRKLARLAKLAGAPQSLAAGISMHVRLGDEVARGQTLLRLHAQTQGELAYALGYANEVGEIVRVAQ